MEFGDWSGDHVPVRSSQQCGVSPVSSAAVPVVPCCRRSMCETSVCSRYTSSLVFTVSTAYIKVWDIRDSAKCVRTLTYVDSLGGQDHLLMLKGRLLRFCVPGHRARWVQVTPLPLSGVSLCHRERVRSTRSPSTRRGTFSTLLLVMLCVCGTSASKPRNTWRSERRKVLQYIRKCLLS